MSDHQAFDKMFGMYLYATEAAEEQRAMLEHYGLRLAIAVAYLHQGKRTQAEAAIKDIRVLGKHPYDLTDEEIAYLVSRAVPE